MSSSNVEERTSIKVCVEFLLEIQHGVVSMTRKQITKQVVKKHKQLKISRNLTWWNHKWKHCLLLPVLSGVYSLQIHPKRPNSQQGLLYRNSDEITFSYEFKNVNFSPTIGPPSWQYTSSPVSLFQSSLWHKNSYLNWNAPSAHQFWLWMTLGSLRNWSPLWRDYDVRYTKKCYGNAEGYSVMSPTVALSLG
jgi:hypothetical protein